MAKRAHIKTVYPNGHQLTLEAFTDESYETPGETETVWVVTGPGAEDYGDEGDEFDSLAEAEAFFETERARLAGTPNWSAQAAYDEQWGTDNGGPRYARIEA